MLLNKKQTPDSSDSDDVFFSFKTLRSEVKKTDEVVVPADDEVINIYHQHMPKKLERKSRTGLKIFIIGILILIISGLGFYYYGKHLFVGGQFYAGKNVKLEITGLSEVSAGGEVSYVVNYKNLEAIDLANVVLTVDYPQNFVYKKSKPLATSKNNNSWDLGYLRSGASGQVEITGAIVGDQDEESVLHAQLAYNMGTDKSSSEQTAEIKFKISSAVLSLELTGPSRLLGPDVKYILDYANTSDSPVEDIKIIVTYPEGFEFTDSLPLKPQENSANSVWLITQLHSKQEGRIVITGKMPMPTGEAASQVKDKILKAQIGILDSQDVFYLQQEKDFTTSLADSELLVNVTLADSLDKVIVKLGDSLKYTANYSNQGKEDLKDVKIKLVINSNILDWSSLTPDDGGVLVDEEIIDGMLARSITWSLDTLKAGATGAYQVKVQTKKYSQLDKTNSLNLRAEAKISAQIGSIGEDSISSNIEGNKIVAQVNTELNFDTQVETEGSNYQLTWKLTNSIHEVENVKISAGLSENIDWLADSSVSAGDLYFDPDTKTVSWQINRIPVGIDIPLVAKFKIKANTDSRPKLLDSIGLVAKDKVTGSEINQSFSEVMGR